MKNNFVVLFFGVVLVLLMSLGTFAQGQVPLREEDLLKKLKLVRVPGSLPAPHFTAETPEGKKMSMRDLRGKLVLLNFWATWCPPCRLEMPSMERLHKEFKEAGLEVVAMNFMEGPRPINSFVKENGFTFKILLDRGGRIAERYGVHALPVTFLIGREGNLLVRSIGYKDWHNMETREFISLLLKDEAIMEAGVKVEVRKGFLEGDRRRQLLVLGVTALILLIASPVLIKKFFFAKK